MTPREKYRDLERRAVALLRRPSEASGSFPLARPELRLVLWRHPSFEPCQSWSLIEEKAVEDLRLLRRVTWNRAADYGRAADPVRQAGFMVEEDSSPTLEVVDVRVSATFLARTMDAVEVLDTPAVPGRSGLGLDGVVNGLAIEDRGVELEWWCEGPPEWHSFTDGVEQLRLSLDATIAG